MFIVLGKVSLLVATASASAVQPSSLLNRLRASAEQFVHAGKADAISIAVVRCGRTHFITEGLADSGTARIATPDTVFEIGSLSKLFAGYLLAKDVVDGRAQLSNDVRRYLSGGYANLNWSDGTPVTLGELVDTSSGLPDYLPDPYPLTKLAPEDQVPAAARMLRGYTNEAFLRDLRQIKLLRRPGEGATHSNVAAQLLGIVIGRLHQASFEHVLHKRLEEPLGIPSDIGTRSIAVGYDGGGKVAPYFEGESILPAGGLRYSARDMAKFLRLQLQTRDPAVALSHRPLFDRDQKIAFTWVVSNPEPGLQKLRMSGGTFGFSSYTEIYPRLGYGIVLLANRSGADMQGELQQIAEGAVLAARQGGELQACRTKGDLNRR